MLLSLRRNQIFDIETGEFQKKLMMFSPIALSSMKSPKYLMAQRYDRDLFWTNLEEEPPIIEVSVYDLSSGEKIGELEGSACRLDYLMSFSPSEECILGGVGGGFAIWDAKTARLIRKVEVKGVLHKLFWSHCGERILSLESGTKKLKLWDARTGLILHDFGSLDFSGTAQFTQDGSLLIQNEREVALYDKESFEKVHGIPLRGMELFVGHDPIGEILVTLSSSFEYKPVINFWNIKSGTITHVKMYPRKSCFLKGLFESSEDKIYITHSEGFDIFDVKKNPSGESRAYDPLKAHLRRRS